MIFKFLATNFISKYDGFGLYWIQCFLSNNILENFGLLFIPTSGHTASDSYFLGVYGLTWLANRRRVKRINLQEQFIMAYGGLRGAVGFSLVEMINKETVPPKEMFVTTMLATVVFTVFFQVASKYLRNG